MGRWGSSVNDWSVNRSTGSGANAVLSTHTCRVGGHNVPIASAGHGRHGEVRGSDVALLQGLVIDARGAIDVSAVWDSRGT
jgi:hypothetical protein